MVPPVSSCRREAHAASNAGATTRVINVRWQGIIGNSLAHLSRARGEKWNAEVDENSVNVGSVRDKFAVHPRPPRGITTPNTHRDIENERREREIDRRRHVGQREWHPRLFGEVARERTPGDGDV